MAGIDVGGTFTDLVLLEAVADGPARVRVAKTPTTPENQAFGVMAAIAQAGISPAALDLVLHGTTTTTNAVLEGKTAKVGLVTTRGFRDILELGRRTRPAAYGMRGTFEPLVPRERRLEVTERMRADGQVHETLDEAEARSAIVALREMGCESLLIHFLHAYANPAHELRVGEIAAGLWPNGYITLGHRLLSEFREYERSAIEAIVLLAAKNADDGPHLVVVGIEVHARCPDDLEHSELRRVVQGGDPSHGRGPQGCLNFGRAVHGTKHQLLHGDLRGRFAQDRVARGHELLGLKHASTLSADDEALTLMDHADAPDRCLRQRARSDSQA